MREKIYPVCFFMFLILLIASSSFAEDASGPRLSFEETAFDAKEIKMGDNLEHSFKVFNKGDSPLEIKEVKTT